MKAPRTRLARFVADKTLANADRRQLSRELAAYLLTERRVGELDSLLRDVEVDWAAAGIVEVTARSAYPLSAGVKRDITNRMRKLYPQAKRIIVSEVNDPALIGGVRLNFVNRQLDLSLRTKLDNFKQLTSGKE